jgi:hypothetical protein
LKILILVLGLVTLAHGQADCATDNLIRVRDLNRKFVAGADVELFEAESGRFVLRTGKIKNEAYLLQDILGQFRDAQGKHWRVSDKYILQVSASGFEDQRRNVTFQNCRPVTIEIDLRPASVVAGTVYDDNGAVIPGVLVRFKSGNIVHVTKTNESGEFEVWMNSGNYSVETVSPPGFQHLKMEKFRVAPSYKGKMSLDLVLEVACGECHGIEGVPVVQTKPN